MENAYAEALWKMLQKGMKPKEAVRTLSELLTKSGRQSLLPKIGRAFVKIAEREESRTRVILSVAREKDARRAHKEVKKLLSDMRVPSVDVTVHVDDSLIGGWRLEGRENLIDASFKKHLVSIYNRATTV